MISNETIIIGIHCFVGISLAALIIGSIIDLAARKKRAYADDDIKHEDEDA